MSGLGRSCINADVVELVAFFLWLLAIGFMLVGGRAWVQGEGFRQAHSGPRADFIVGHARFRGYDVRLSSEPRQAKAAV